MFHSFFISLARSRELILFFTFLQIYSVVRRDSKVDNFADSLSFVNYNEVWSSGLMRSGLLAIMRSGLLADGLSLEFE